MLRGFIVVLSIIMYAVAVLFPGIVAAYLGWTLSRGWNSVSAETFLRAALMAVALTPSVWGHAGILPAILLAIILSGREKLAGVPPVAGGRAEADRKTKSFHGMNALCFSVASYHFGL
jgi:hypothetical protein